MQITTYPFPQAITEKHFYKKTAIVVDVLRATTSIVEALKNGAAQIITARDPAEAMAFYSHFGRKDSVLAGERGGLRIADFELGNSPLEFSEKVVKNKTVVICTTNGTQAIHACRGASRLLIGAMRNRAAVAKEALKQSEDITIICAGTLGECSLDDVIASGGILNTIIEQLEVSPELNDFSRICLSLYSSWRKGEVEMSGITHYKKLFELGFIEDLSFCFELDKTDVVPKYSNGSIKG